MIASATSAAWKIDGANSQPAAHRQDMSSQLRTVATRVPRRYIDHEHIASIAKVHAEKPLL